MSTITEPFLESWDRQARIFMNLAGRVSESNKNLKPAPEGWTIAEHLAHVHNCRSFWLEKASQKHASGLGETYEKVDGAWRAIESLDEIKNQLNLSAAAVRAAVSDALKEGVAPMGPYDHPVFFLQHMLWHEGYHFGLVVLALRNGGEEPPEEWEEQNVWGIWRVEE